MAEKKKRTLKPIEQCPDGHYYNSGKTGDICAVCGKQLDPPEEDEMTPDELEEQAYQDRLEWACGWLVCIKGASKGMDYKIKEGKNFIGSASSMDIQIVGDKRVEKKNHAIVLYDSKTRTTMLLPGDSRGMIYLEEKAVFKPETIEAFNKIEIGDSLFIYAPLCGGGFDWKDVDDK